MLHEKRPEEEKKKQNESFQVVWPIVNCSVPATNEKNFRIKIIIISVYESLKSLRNYTDFFFGILNSK